MTSREFIESAVANLKYWQELIQTTGERQYKALNEDWSNIYRAMQFGSQLIEAHESASEFALAAGGFVERSGHWNEWLVVFDRLLAVREQFTVSEQALLLEEKGNLLRLTRRVSEAIEAHHQAEQMMRRAGDGYQVARLSHALSEDYLYQRNYLEAEKWAFTAWTWFEQLGLADQPGKGGAVLNTLGQIAYAQGDYSLAEDRFRKSINLWSQIDAPTELARLLNNLGRVLQASGRFKEALKQFTEAAKLLNETQSELDRVEVAMSLGTLYAMLEDWDAALITFQKADIQFLEESGHFHYLALLNNNLGNILMEQGHLAEAEIHLRSSIKLWQQTEDQVMLANTLGSLGETLFKLGRFSEALQVYRNASSILNQYSEDAWARHLLQKHQAKIELIPQYLL